MYKEEIATIIYNTNDYNYMILNKKLKVIDSSTQLFDFFNFQKQEIINVDIFELMPEFIGMEDDFEALSKEQKKSFSIPHVFKSPSFYINIDVYYKKLDDVDVFLILLKNISSEIETQEKIMQERNEKALLLTQIAEKNRQLQRFNEEMEALVQVEIAKNIEKQKVLELQSRHAQMGEMIAMITHQWKQPLNVINLISGMIKLKYPLGKLDKKTIDKATTKLDKQVDYMYETIHDFQNFFNPLKEKVKFNLKESILSVLGLIQYDYEMKKISVELIENEPLWIYGFPNEYNQVLLSLLSNAKDAFLSNPHDDMKIIITIDSDKGKSLVKVEDNAGGISSDIIDTIFDIYMTTKKTGSGLGLNIAKNIIEKNMNGKLSVSTLKNGTEFSILV